MPCLSLPMSGSVGNSTSRLRAFGLDPLEDELQSAVATYPASLSYGMIRAGHALVPFLHKYGASDSEIGWFEQKAQKPDIVGYNYYPDIAAAGWKPGIDQENVDFSGNGARPLEQAAKNATAPIKSGLLRAQKYFDRPVCLTETSAGLSIEARVAYANALGDMIGELCRERTSVVGLNWWPLFDTIQWDYREECRPATR